MPKIFLSARDPISSYTHFLGAALSLAGLAGMMAQLAVGGVTNLTTIISSLLFCLSLIALYSASGFYHFIKASAQIIARMRKVDHAMIYVLIAGSYTPLLLKLFPAPLGLWLTIGIWGLAAAGILVKLCWMDAPRWLGTLLYILMGWAIALDFPALKALPVPAFALLAAGGLLYTAGGVIYACKRPNLTSSFGFHELFHLFVLAGSLCHYLMVLLYIA